MSTRLHKSRLAHALLALALASAMAAIPAVAQKAPTEKKIYCWDDGGEKVCSDSLPASAVDNARTELSARGIATARIERAKTEEERAAATIEAKQREQSKLAEAKKVRQEQAMVVSFASEAELERNFAHRIELIDASIQTSRAGIAGSRRSLLNLLQRASDSELENKPVPKALAERIATQHDSLRHHQQLLDRQIEERGTIDQDLAAALARYRELKAASPHASVRSN